MLNRVAIFAGLAALFSVVSADHRINVINNCGYGTPTMYGPAAQAPYQNGPLDISGGYTSAGDLNSFIIYLQNNGQCGANGDNCLILEGSLNGGFSSVDISKLQDGTTNHAFNSPLGFSYDNGAGSKRCASADCICNVDAFCKTDDYGAQIGSPDVNAGITVTFC